MTVGNVASLTCAARSGSPPCLVASPGTVVVWLRSTLFSLVRSVASLLRATHLSGHRSLARVVVEALTRFPPFLARGDEIRERLGGREAILAVCVVHDLGDRGKRVEADEVGERQRPHRVTGAGLHPGVDVLDRANP